MGGGAWGCLDIRRKQRLVLRAPGPSLLEHQLAVELLVGCLVRVTLHEVYVQKRKLLLGRVVVEPVQGVLVGQCAVLLDERLHTLAVPGAEEDEGVCVCPQILVQKKIALGQHHAITPTNGARV